MTVKRFATVSLAGAFLAVSTFALAACAGAPPRESVASARFALDEAERAGGDEHASLEVHVARERLTQAEGAIARKDYSEAQRAAEQALVNAQLAEAKAEYVATQRAIEELRQSNEILRSETERVFRFNTPSDEEGTR